MTSDGEWLDCFACGGSGESNATCDWDGRCVYCHGSGQRFVPYPDGEEWECE